MEERESEGEGDRVAWKGGEKRRERSEGEREIEWQGKGERGEKRREREWGREINKNLR